MAMWIVVSLGVVLGYVFRCAASAGACEHYDCVCGTYNRGS